MNVHQQVSKGIIVFTCWNLSNDLSLDVKELEGKVIMIQLHEVKEKINKIMKLLLILLCDFTRESFVITKKMRFTRELQET